MRRTWAVLIFAGIVVASAGGAALIFWQANAHSIPIFYVLGGLTIVLGVLFSALHLSVSDEYLRKYFGGDENAARLRQMWQGGWVGVPLGAALIAAQYFLGAYLPMP
jgi:hypothetical protein